MISIEPNETKLLEVRRHPLLFTLSALGLFALAVAPLAAGSFFVKSGIILETSLPFLAIAAVVWLMVMWMLLFMTWTAYYLDVWVVTTRRIINFKFKGLFRYETSSARLDRIQDITIEVNGLLANLFGFGTIRVETAGESTTTFIIADADNPEAVKKIMLAEHHKSMEARGATPQATV